jgi:hypothetical protein
MLSGVDGCGSEAVTAANEVVGEGLPADVDINGSTALSLSIFAFGKDLDGDDFNGRPLTPAKTPEIHGVNGEATVVNGDASIVNGDASIVDGDASVVDGEATLVDEEATGVAGEVNGDNGVANGVDGNSPDASLINFAVYIPGLSESSGGPSLIHREP